MASAARFSAAASAWALAAASASACAALVAAALSASAFLAAASFSSLTSRVSRSRASRRSATGSIRRVLVDTFAVLTTEAEVDHLRESGALLKERNNKKEIQKESAK